MDLQYFPVSCNVQLINIQPHFIHAFRGKTASVCWSQQGREWSFKVTVLE